MADDDDEGGFGGAFEDGHWVWDDITQALLFVSDLPLAPVESIQIQTKMPTGAIEFRDDVDLIEQVRYRRRYQRKLLPGQADIITLQDVKDIALYTAPHSILSPMLINLLHMPTTERFLRALILCCAYYLQIADEMAERMMELQTKVRTPMCDRIENMYRDNLADLRVLVAKEYCTMLIELETHRLFKSEIFNNVEHTLKTRYIAQMVPEEQNVLLGPCVRYDKKLNTCSPLMNEVFCDRSIDYRLMGLGIVRYPELTIRLRFLRLLIAEAEDNLEAAQQTLGIIGMPRSRFDTMLRPIMQIEPSSKSKASSMQQAACSSIHSSKSSVRKMKKPLYPRIDIPEKGSQKIFFPPSFPDEIEKSIPVNHVQQKRWLTRLTKLLAAPTAHH